MSDTTPVTSTPGASATPAVKPAKRPRHLMDPNNPQRTVNNVQLTRVQRWVWAVMIATTMWHMALGIAVASLVLTEDATSARIGLNVIAAAFGVLGMMGGFAMHKKNSLTWPYVPWLLVGVIPGVVGAFFAFR